MIHTLTLSPAIDRTYILSDLGHTEVSRANDVHDAASGKGVNVLRFLTALGIEARATVLLGGPLGDYFCSLCDPEWPIDVIPIAENTRLNVSLRIESPQMALKINEEGASISLGDTDALLHDLDRKLTAGDWLAICGSTPPGVDPEVFLGIRSIVRKRDVRLALDIPNLTLPQILELGPDVFKPNLHEFREITGEAPATVGDVLRSARRLAELARIDWVIVTLGALGAAVSHDGRDVYVPIADPAVVHPVGAGDALLAGFLGGLTRGEDWEQAFWFGVAASYALATEGPRATVSSEHVESLAATMRDSVARVANDVDGLSL